MFKRVQLKEQCTLSFTKHDEFYFASQAFTILKVKLTAYCGKEYLKKKKNKRILKN